MTWVTVEMSRPRAATSVATRIGSAAALEGEHHAVALALGHVAVQRLDVQAAVAQRAVELVAADLRAREDDRLVGVLGAQHLDELLGLVAGLHVDRELLDAVDGQRRRLDLDVTGS